MADQKRPNAKVGIETTSFIRSSHTGSSEWCLSLNAKSTKSFRKALPSGTLTACERDTWSLIKRKDLQGFGSYLAEDFYDIFPDGKERTKSELLEFLGAADLKDYRLSNFRVTMLNQNAAIVTYQVDAHASIQGKDITMKNSVTSGWANRGGRWLNVSAVASAAPPRQ